MLVAIGLARHLHERRDVADDFDAPPLGGRRRNFVVSKRIFRSRHVCNTLLNRLVAHLLRKGHEVLVICPSGRPGRSDIVRHAGASIVRVPSVPFPIWWEYRLTWGLGHKVAAQLKRFEPTVVHIAIQDAMGHAAQRWARRRGIAVLCSHHTRFERYLGYYGLGALEGAYWFGMRRFHGRCAATLPPSASLARNLASHGLPRVGVWPRGVDCSLYRPAARSEAWRLTVGGEGASAEAPIVLLVARLRWEKGLRTFAQVVAQLVARGVRHRVVVVGDGPAREGLAALLPASTAFLGALMGASLAEAYASSDIFLYPSTTEGWGATCLEAQAAGLPVVATASPGIVEVHVHVCMCACVHVCMCVCVCICASVHLWHRRCEPIVTRPSITERSQRMHLRR